jgi:hypothetical protein
MNCRLVPAAAAFLILSTLLSATPLSFAQTYSLGPMLQVTMIPQDNQKLGTGVMILGINPTKGPTGAKAVAAKDLMSQHKLLVTYNGLPMSWHIGSTEPQPLVFCNFVEKDKVNVVPDPKTGDGKQGSWENLMTAMVDVSNDFVCKVRWKSPAPGVYESVGVLDVYYKGAFDGHFIADTILVVEATLVLGRTVISGSDIQDICVLGWAPGATVDSVTNANWTITKPDGTQYYIWQNAMGSFISCEDLALAERDALGITLSLGQDSLGNE